ncbi:E3 ubiquitin-protein ligase CCNB1IP1-like [Uranotaenia lowii]|uniref:E3 ubiquitin-protein ligase CCNB1IP1-like n=1 Tax=Uranotaenia lowii TaxID=190385 RepID=UPI00247AF966|nr:E3 ubiquitin-protein ligase CCNB1IP1-like [Uranotaenia lowii]
MGFDRDNLVCNARECFKQIETTAWITNCSHVFCDHHGKEIKLRRKGAAAFVCPACASHLREDGGLTERKLNTSTNFQALLLCGYHPETVMEIANNAITFWNFQKQQICINLERKVEYYRESIAKMKKTAAQDRAEAQSKIESLQQQLEQVLVHNSELQKAPTKRDSRGNHPRHCEKKRRMNDFL